MHGGDTLVGDVLFRLVQSACVLYLSIWIDSKSIVWYSSYSIQNVCCDDVGSACHSA